MSKEKKKEFEYPKICYVNKEQKDRIKAEFNKFDKDNSGYITRNEFYAVLKDEFKDKIDITDQMIDEMIKLIVL
jgi:Ca2+-binding EF-hand superfamily protein